MTATAAAMREVVERLRTEGSPAFGELLDLHTAVDEMVRGFEQLAEAAGRVSETAEFMLESLRELRRGRAELEHLEHAQRRRRWRKHASTGGVMTDPSARARLVRTLKDLAEAADTFERAADALDRSLGLLRSGAMPEETRQSVGRIRRTAMTLVLTLLAITAHAERVATLAELDPSVGVDEQTAADPSADAGAALEHAREAAVAALAAAFLKEPSSTNDAGLAIRAARESATAAVDAIAEYVIAKIRGDP